MSIEAAAKHLTEQLNAQMSPRNKMVMIKSGWDADGKLAQHICVSFRTSAKAAVPPSINGYEVRVVDWED